jgi:hypothetical protein
MKSRNVRGGCAESVGLVVCWSESREKSNEPVELNPAILGKPASRLFREPIVPASKPSLSTERRDTLDDELLDKIEEVGPFPLTDVGTRRSPYASGNFRKVALAPFREPPLADAEASCHAGGLLAGGNGGNGLGADFGRVTFRHTYPSPRSA